MTWTVTVVEDPETGEYILPLPPDMLEQVGWETGDTIVWKDEGNGAWSLSKKEAHSKYYYDPERNK